MTQRRPLRLLAAALVLLAQSAVAAPDYYAVLNVSKDADAKDIKSAYRKMALKWHPDKNPDDRENAEVKFREVAEAYEVLSDPDRRRQYDAGGAAPGGGGGGGGGFGDFGFGDMFRDPKDLFKDMFGDADPFADFSKFFDDIKFEDFGGSPGEDETKASEKVLHALSAFYRATGEARHEEKAKELLNMPKWKGKEQKLARTLKKKYPDLASRREFQDFEATVAELDKSRNVGGGSGEDPFAGFGGFGDLGNLGGFGGLGDIGKAFGMGGLGGFGDFGGFGGGASTTMSFSSFSSSGGGKTVKKETRVEGGRRVTKTIESDERGTRAVLEEEQNGRVKRQTGVRHKEQLAQGDQDL